MNVTRIELVFDKTLTSLAGNPYGVNIYNKQVKDKFNWAGKNVIVFPSHIDDIAVSFVQGFFSEIIEKIGIEGFENQVQIEAGSDKFIQKIIDNI